GLAGGVRGETLPARPRCDSWPQCASKSWKCRPSINLPPVAADVRKPAPSLSRGLKLFGQMELKCPPHPACEAEAPEPCSPFRSHRCRWALCRFGTAWRRPGPLPPKGGEGDCAFSVHGPNAPANANGGSPCSINARKSSCDTETRRAPSRPRLRHKPTETFPGHAIRGGRGRSSRRP